MTSRPVASRARARARTANAPSVPSRPTAGAIDGLTAGLPSARHYIVLDCGNDRSERPARDEERSCLNHRRRGRLVDGRARPAGAECDARDAGRRTRALRLPRLARRRRRDGAVVTFFLGLSSATFLLALNYTSVANVLFLQASAPVMAALLGWVILSERISRRTWIAMLMAAIGVGAMVIGSFHAGPLAVALPIVMTFSFAIVIVLTRYRRDVSMMPATCASQALVVVVVAPV